jgi:hypothetical protein
MAFPRDRDSTTSPKCGGVDALTLRPVADATAADSEA